MRQLNAFKSVTNLDIGGGEPRRIDGPRCHEEQVMVPTNSTEITRDRGDLKDITVNGN